MKRLGAGSVARRQPQPTRLLVVVVGAAAEHPQVQRFVEGVKKNDARQLEQREKGESLRTIP